MTAATMLGVCIGLVELSLTTPTLAADVTYSADTSVTLTTPPTTVVIKAGSTATSLTVTTDTIEVILPALTHFHVTSADRVLTMTGQTPSAVLTTGCDSSVSSLLLTTTAIETVTITPSGSVCTPSSTAPIRNGGGSAAPGWAIIAPRPSPPQQSLPTSTAGHASVPPSSGSVSRDLARERAALRLFTRLYPRLPQSSADWRAIHYLAYGASSPQRSLPAEIGALSRFIRVFRRLPASAYDWRALHLIAYPQLLAGTGSHQLAPRARL